MVDDHDVGLVRIQVFLVPYLHLDTKQVLHMVHSPDYEPEIELSLMVHGPDYEPEIELSLMVHGPDYEPEIEVSHIMVHDPDYEPEIEFLHVLCLILLT